MAFSSALGRFVGGMPWCLVGDYGFESLRWVGYWPSADWLTCSSSPLMGTTSPTASCPGIFPTFTKRPYGTRQDFPQLGFALTSRLRANRAQTVKPRRGKGDCGDTFRNRVPNELRRSLTLAAILTWLTVAHEKRRTRLPSASLSLGKIPIFCGEPICQRTREVPTLRKLRQR